MAIHKIKFFAGRGSRYLAEKIVASYGTKLGESEVLNFSDGEFQPCFLESIRGCTVFVIQSTFPPTDNLMELLMMIDAAKRANTYAKYLHTPIIISHKERAKANVVGKMTAIGDVEGRNIIIVDDMIDTAGTICMAADMLMKKGAKSVRAAITHPVLSGSAYDKINDSALQEVIVTDTIPLREGEDLRKFTVLSVADIFADVVERVHNYKEISSIFFK